MIYLYKEEFEGVSFSNFLVLLFFLRLATCDR